MAFHESDYGFDGGSINSAWQTRAQCRDVHPEALWPLPHAGVLVEEARRICDGCSVRLDCLQDGEDAREWDSVRGGLTGEERRTHHRAGLAVGDYPLPVLVVKLKWCPRCSSGFERNEANPMGRLCPSCAAGSVAPHMRKTTPCGSCSTTAPDSRRRGLCDTCYAADHRARKAVAA